MVRSRVKRSSAESPSGPPKPPDPGGASMVRMVSSSSFLVREDSRHREGQGFVRDRLIEPLREVAGGSVDSDSVND